MRRAERKQKETAEIIRILTEEGRLKDVRKPEGHLRMDEGYGFMASSVAQAEIEIKYGGYLEKEASLVSRMRAMEDYRLPDDAPYAEMSALRLEARQKLAAQRPSSLGQASRIPGVSPADVSVLMVWLMKNRPAGAEK